MIDWHHPRIYERLRCFGLCLFAIGLAFQNTNNPPAAFAAFAVAALLAVRLKIELTIGHNEDMLALERKLQRIQQINTAMLVPVIFGVMAILSKLETGRSFTSPFGN
jgi:long-subunit fatty acid transport protein